MSYVSSFVQAKPGTEILAKKTTATSKAKAENVAVKKELTTKILLFAAIIVCLVVAVNI